jgi:ketosteroid isomerase-like protein
LQNTFAFFKQTAMQIHKAAFLLPAVFASMFIFSCNQDNTTREKNYSAEEVLQADRAFSDMSRQVGMKKAFLEYIDNEGVLLRPNHLPVTGAEAIDFLSQVNDSSYKLSWTPMKGEIARSGELGFTYGIYELATKDTVIKGTYVSIWKKQNNGAWKFVLDSGNEGIGKQP